MIAATTLGVLIGLAAAAPAPRDASTLVATIQAGPREGSVEVEYRNNTGEAVTIDKQVLQSGILALDVLDSKGNVIPTVPPPIPSAKQEFVTIAAGSSHKQIYSLNHFSPPLPAGKYQVRVGVPGWKSSDFTYEVKDAK